MHTISSATNSSYLSDSPATEAKSLNTVDTHKNHDLVDIHTRALRFIVDKFIDIHKKSLLLIVSLLLCQPALSQQNFDNVVIQTVPINGNVSMLVGSGGNIGVLAGPDGILIIDDQYAPLSGRIKQALAELGSDTPKFVVNTHFHGDHTGGNEAFGAGGVIIAHQNVRARLLDTVSAVALPVVTYDDDITINFNGEELTLIHMPNGHTDSDSVVMFANANVIHMGDHFFNGAFPFIDIANGGTVQGYLNNLERALSWIEDDTRVIPGHGPLGGKEDLLNFYNVVKDTSIAVRVKKSQQMTKEEIVAEGLDSMYESWGQGFINEQSWIETIFDSYPR